MTNGEYLGMAVGRGSVQLAGHYMLRARGIDLIPASSPTFFVEDTPTAVLVRQVLGAVAQFERRPQSPSWRPLGGGAEASGERQVGLGGFRVSGASFSVRRDSRPRKETLEVNSRQCGALSRRGEAQFVAEALGHRLEVLPELMKQFKLGLLGLNIAPLNAKPRLKKRPTGVIAE